MPKALTSEQVDHYNTNGFLFPVEAYTSAEAAALYRRYAETEEKAGEELQKRFRVKAHLPFPWLCDIIRHPKLLDAVEDILGPNILCWGSSFFSKNAHDPRYISWHTDSFYYGLRPPETLSAWVAFNDSSIEAGCVQYIPGSHKVTAVHEFKPHPNNLAGNGQSVIGVEESKAVHAVLKAGQAVFHHESVVHGSGPNNADHPRVGFVIHYIAPHVRETRIEGAMAMLVRGRDTHGYWTPEPEPKVDFDPHCIDVMMKTRALFKEATNNKVAQGIAT
ncbi:MAG TPA: phytanoyl-CoA dioxygenase family protein [Alphaproteobacteria bacterium]|jgi:chlorinating enzyme|nr:phytanoyl-CoA dioxygenase family protein [Alphaproteobacteria bacterium]